MFAAEHATRNCPRVFLSFDNLLERPVEVLTWASQTLQLDFSHPPQTIASQLHQFLEPTLKHHTPHHDEYDPHRFALMSEYYSILCSFAEHLEADVEPYWTQIDTLRAQYDQLAAWFYNQDMRSYVYALQDARQQIRALSSIVSPDYMAQLFVDTGIGFNETQSMTNPIEGYERTLEFDLSTYNDLKALRFDPLNDLTALHLTAIQFVTADGKCISIESYQTNACFQNGHNLLFDTHDPGISFAAPVEHAQKLVIAIEYIALGYATYRYLLAQTAHNNSAGKTPNSSSKPASCSSRHRRCRVKTLKSVKKVS